MSVFNLVTTDPDDPTNDLPTEPDPEWDTFTRAVRTCLACRRLASLGPGDALAWFCGTHDRLLDEILVPYSVDIEASDDYAALCREMEAGDD